MKLLLILALVIVPGLQGTFAVRISFHSLAEKGIENTTQSHYLKARNTASKGEFAAGRFREKNKALADLTERCDTVMPPLCLLMLIWLTISLSGPEKEKP